MLEVTISDVSITNVGFAIFLKPRDEHSPKVVPIFIGPLETYSISSALDGVKPPRPNTHDLIVNMLGELNSKVMHIVINDIIGHIFYARIIIESTDGVLELDSRPSDAIAVAIRLKCRILMNEKVYDEAAVLVGDDVEDETTTELPADETDISPPESSEPVSELDKLNRNLQKAVDVENFEEAAIIRDKIRSLQQEN